MGLGLKRLFRNGVPIGRLIKGATDLDEEAEASVKAIVDVAMERIAENLITMLTALKDRPKGDE